ncbi:MAG: alpha-ribazole phosphatase [Bacillota bacterium]
MEQRLIYLTRHGAVKINGTKRFIGQTDLPLSGEGIRQAKCLKQELSCVRFSNVFCSDLQRSVQTAGIIAEKHAIRPVACPELREINLGNWEGRTFEEVCRKYPEEFKQRGKDIANYRPTGGESFADCSSRVLNKFNDLVQSSVGNILIAGHAGVNRVILCHILGMPLQHLFRIGQDYGCLNLILLKHFGFRLIKLNQVYKIMSF